LFRAAAESFDDLVAAISSRSSAAWPLAARAQQGNRVRRIAQQGDRVRRIGVLMPLDENDSLAKTYVSAFIQALAGR
jgi:hypothetical protein